LRHQPQLICELAMCFFAHHHKLAQLTHVHRACVCAKQPQELLLEGLRLFRIFLIHGCSEVGRGTAPLVAAGSAT
jgi:hypothetical protein